MVLNTNLIESRCKQILRMNHIHAKQELRKLIGNCIVNNDKESLSIIANNIGLSLFNEVVIEIKSFLEL